MAEIPQEEDVPQAPHLPIGNKQHLACRRCHIILSQAQFTRDGCPNCATGAIDPQDLHSIVTTKFSGYMGIVDSSNSWIARLVGCKRMPSGVYAANVEDDEVDDDDDEGADDDDVDEDAQNEGAKEVAATDTPKA